MENQTQTIGQSRIRTNFNPSENPCVKDVKQQSANLIDILQALKNDEVSKTYEESEFHKKIVSGEKLRLIAFAQTAYEEAAMWAVKAITI